jgi:hypothetical protein
MKVESSAMSSTLMTSWKNAMLTAVMLTAVLLALAACAPPPMHSRLESDGLTGEARLLSSTQVGDDRMDYERSVVGIQYFYGKQNMESFCTGVLIRADVVATAAHCFDRKLMGNYTDINILHGSNLYAYGLRNAAARKIVDKVIHPRYDSLAYEEVIPSYSSKPIHRSYYDHDIALLLLDRSFGAEASVARLSSSYSSPVGMKLTVYGYGKAFDATDARSYIAARRSFEGTLQRTNIVLSGKTRKDRLLTNSDGGICQGDSGGPSFITDGGRDAILFAINSASSGKFLGPISIDQVRVCRGEGVLQPVGPEMGWVQQTLRRWRRL